MELFLRVLLFILATFVAYGSDYIVTLYHRNGSVVIIRRRCDAAGALFGPDLDDDEFLGCPIYVHPVNACSKIDPPSSYSNVTDRYTCLQYVAMVERGVCTYAQKAFVAQSANFQAIIVYDNEYHDGPSSMGPDGVFDSKVKIPAFFITRRCGLYLQNASLEAGNTLVVTKIALDFTKYLLPFVVVVGVCFLMALVALVVKFVREKRHEWRKRLSRRKLKRIPTKKFKKNDIVETCPICLEDFEDGDNMRILPCNHWYHVKCVDPWLTKNRKICPVCKRKVLKDDSDDSSSSDDQAGPSGPADQADESAPLLTPAADSPISARHMRIYGSTDDYFSPSNNESTNSGTSTVTEVGESPADLLSDPVAVNTNYDDDDNNGNQPAIGADSIVLQPDVIVPEDPECFSSLHEILGPNKITFDAEHGQINPAFKKDENNRHESDLASDSVRPKNDDVA